MAFMASTMVWNCIPAFWLLTISVARSTLLPVWSAGAVDGVGGDLHLRGVAGGDGLGQAGLEIDVLGLEIGRVDVGDVVGRGLLLSPQPLHGLVYGRSGDVTEDVAHDCCPAGRLARALYTVDLRNLFGSPVPGVCGVASLLPEYPSAALGPMCEVWADLSRRYRIFRRTGTAGRCRLAPAVEQMGGGAGPPGGAHGGRPPRHLALAQGDVVNERLKSGR